MDANELIHRLEQAQLTPGSLVQQPLRNDPRSYRVEAVDGDGGCEVAIFSGPNALDRAIVFAGGGYYDAWADPDGLAGY